MKGIIGSVVLFMCMLAPMVMTAQSLREVMPIVEENKIWIIQKVFCSDYSGNIYYTKLVMKGDTTIGKYQYKKVQVQPYCDSFYFMRETDTFYGFANKVYTIDPSERNYYDGGQFVYAYYPGNQHENLLYFWQKNGMTIQHIHRIVRDSNELYWYRIPIKQYYGRMSSQIAVPYPAQWTLGDFGTSRQHTWQERIGSKENLFYNTWEFFTAFIHYRVDCVWKDDTLLYSNVGNGNACLPFVADFSFSGQCLGDTSRIDFYTCEQIDVINWDLGDGTTLQTNGNVNSINHYYPQAGDYKITMAAIRGMDTLRLNKYLVIRERPDDIYLGPDTALCADEFVLSPNIQAYKYYWSTGDTTPSLTITKSGTYSLLAGHNSCVVTDTISIALFKQPEIVLDSVYSICEGENLALSVWSSNPGMNYVWSDGSTQPYTTFYDSGFHTVKILNGECYDSASFYIHQNPFPNGFASDTLIHCEKELFELKSPDSNSPLIQIGGITDSIFYFEPDTSITVLLIHKGCSTSQEIVIQSGIPHTAVTDRNPHVCPGDTLVVDISLKAGEKLTWEDGDTLESKVFFSIRSDTVLLYIANEKCYKTDTVFLSPMDIKSPLQDEVVVCAGESKLLILPKGFQYFINGLAILDSLPITGPGDFIVTMNDSNQCTLLDTIKVSEAVFPLSKDTLVCGDFTVKLMIPAGYHFVETADFTFSNSGFVFPKAGNYAIAIEDVHSCKSIYWNIELEKHCQAFIPSAFSPNGDGLNDDFKPVVYFGNYSLTIYNRWGEILINSKDENVFWDGKFNGELCPEGVYFYIITLEDANRAYHGVIHLLR